MATIYEVDSSLLIERTSEELKKSEELQPPEWASFVKTGMSKERPPQDKDWWYKRSASVLRKIYRMGPIGVSKLRNIYGSKKNRGVKKSHAYPASGSIIRKILQQLEKAGYVKNVEKGQFKGRRITAKGRSFLDKVATQIYSTKPVKTEEKKVKKVEEKPKVVKEVKPEPKKEIKK
tara:strand:+ start:13375 stop:13902 length:528 start_codon:yes stop_codon:yes gene_type:complete